MPVVQPKDPEGDKVNLNPEWEAARQKAMAAVIARDLERQAKIKSVEAQGAPEAMAARKTERAEQRQNRQFVVLKNQATGKYMARRNKPVFTRGDHLGTYDAAVYDAVMVDRLPSLDELEENTLSPMERRAQLCQRLDAQLAKLPAADRAKAAMAMATAKQLVLAGDAEAAPLVFDGLLLETKGFEKKVTTLITTAKTNGVFD